MKPIIGITVDNKSNSLASGKYLAGTKYAEFVAETGGLPVFLPQEVSRIPDFLALCHGIILSGGDDPIMAPFNRSQHPRSTPICPHRQQFEMQLLAQLQTRPDLPVLAVCLGMQLMALFHGGEIDQFLPDNHETADQHMNGTRHAVSLVAADSVLHDATGLTLSHHRQAVTDPGDLRIVARAKDRIIEAIDDPQKPFYLGVQWHPERGDKDPVSFGLIQNFVHACDAYRTATNAPSPTAHQAATPRQQD